MPAANNPAIPKRLLIKPSRVLIKPWQRGMRAVNATFVDVELATLLWAKDVSILNPELSGVAWAIDPTVLEPEPAAVSRAKDVTVFNPISGVHFATSGAAILS